MSHKVGEGLFLLVWVLVCRSNEFSQNKGINSVLRQFCVYLYGGLRVNVMIVLILALKYNHIYISLLAHFLHCICNSNL